MAITTQPLEKQRQDSISSDLHHQGLVGLLLEEARQVGWLTVAILTATVVLLNIFTHQAVMIPQLHYYYANWYSAQWITAASSTSPVQYFRKDFALEVAPVSAFLTVEANQYYQLYVNGTVIDTTSVDVIKSGILYDTNVYDIGPFLSAGANTVAVRAVNQDVGPSQIRAVIGINYGSFQQEFPSNNTWKATDNSLLTLPFLSRTAPNWTSQSFIDSAWKSASYFKGTPQPDGEIPFDPITYERPMPTTWISAGPLSSAFFFHSLALPQFRHVWLRLASTGTSSVFLNGTAAITQPVRLQEDETGTAPPPNVQYTAGVYDITPYVHEGDNAVAVHVSSAGINIVTNALTQSAALVLDLIVVAPNGAEQQIAADVTWLASSKSEAGWTTGAGTQTWQAAYSTSQSVITNVPVYKIALPGLQAAADEVGTTFPLPDLQQYSFQESVLVFMVTTVLLLIFCAAGAALLRLWFAQRGTNSTWHSTISTMAVVLAPGTALLGLLTVLSHLTLIPRPFPYTWPWILLFVAITGVTYYSVLLFQEPLHMKAEIARAARAISSRFRRPSARLQTAIAVFVLAAIGAWMVTYNLGYESFWQDELASIFAATGVVHQGIPTWPAGFLYTKAELYSYMLAGIIAVFGYNPVALRLLSATEYVLVLLLIFYVARYFFGRRVGLLAMALVLCSPFELHWGREARMYQQAQLMVLLVLYLFYRASRPNARTRYIYLSMAAVVAMYLTHEESFIVLPAIFLSFIWTKRLTWIRNKHWWIAGLSALACIAAQLIIWRATRPVLLGTDRSAVFLLHFSPENIDWYLQLFANPASIGDAQLDMFQIVLALAIIAAVIGILRNDQYLRFFSLMVFLPLGILSISLPLTDDRYVYLLLPAMFILDAVVVVRTLHALAVAARRVARPRIAAAITVVVAVMVCLLVLSSEISSPSNVGLAVSRTLGITYHHYHPDYQYAGNYIRAHWEPGDVLIAAAPASVTGFYAGYPAYVLYNGRALSLFEENGAVYTNETGSLVIFNVKDLQQVLARYHRVWLLTDTVRSGHVGNSGSGPIQQNFTLVFEGQNTAVYLYAS